MKALLVAFVVGLVVGSRMVMVDPEVKTIFQL